MNYSLFMLFGRMCPDYEHPVLVARADADVRTATNLPGRTNSPVSFAEVKSFVAEFYERIAEQTSSRSFPLLGLSGLMERGRFLTLNTLALHSADSACSVCSLSEVLEPHVAPKYFLSPTAARGILRRAEKRGKALPPLLRRALENLVAQKTETVIPSTLSSNHSLTGDGLVIEPQTTLGQFGVRRLTPAECEALQGFPREWTAFGHDGKPISDSSRYRMLGNAVCVPTAFWIAERIARMFQSPD